MYIRAYIQNLVKNGPLVFEKRLCQFSEVNDVGRRSRNDLDFEIGTLVLEQRILKGFSIYRHGGHLGHVTSIMLIFFISTCILLKDQRLD